MQQPSLIILILQRFGVDRGDNAGYLAVQMLALQSEKHAAALKQNKLDQIERVKSQDREVNGGA